MKDLDAQGIFENSRHRLEWVKEINAVAYVNDAGAVTAGDTCCSLQRVSRPVVWIAASAPTASDYTPFNGMEVDGIRALIVMGTHPEAIVHVFEGRIELIGKVFTMWQAVAHASLVAERGDTVLFSPACTAGPAVPFWRSGTHFKRVVAEM